MVFERSPTPDPPVPCLPRRRVSEPRSALGSVLQSFEKPACCLGRVGGGCHGGRDGHAMDAQRGEVAESVGCDAADGEDRKRDFGGGRSEKVSRGLVGEGLRRGGIARADPEAVGSGGQCGPGLGKIVGGATDDVIGSEQSPRLGDGHVVGTEMHTIGTGRCGHGDAIVDRDDRRSRGGGLPCEGHGPAATIDEHLIGGGLVADLEHRHAGGKQRGDEPLEGCCVRPGVDEHAEPGGSQSVNQMGGVHRTRNMGQSVAGGRACHEQNNRIEPQADCEDEAN